MRAWLPSPSKFWVGVRLGTRLSGILGAERSRPPFTLHSPVWNISYQAIINVVDAGMIVALLEKGPGFSLRGEEEKTLLHCGVLKGYIEPWMLPGMVLVSTSMKRIFGTGIR
jgi:hypothetical protein